jgi:chloride channel protein, CIC family
MPNLISLRPKQIAILEASLIGLLSGLAAVVLKVGVGWVGGWRLVGAGILPPIVALPLFGAISGGLAGILIQRLAPEASGSGIPQVKAALAYLPMPLTGRIAIVKLISTILSLGAGLTLGRQGPTVQLGAAIASQVSNWFPTSPDHRRQLLAAGAAAGLAAGFNAPIAGVLFVIEELLQDVSGLTLGTAIMASFVGAMVSRQLGGQDFTFSPSSMSIDPYFNAIEIPFFILLGVLAALLGVLFIRGILLSLRLYKQLHLSLPGKIAIAGLLSGLMVALLPEALRDNASLQEVWRTSEFPWHLILLIFTVKFGLTLVAVGSGAPGGLFAPSLILGSTLGYLVCFLVQTLNLWLHLPLGTSSGAGFAVTFALAGMAAFFSAVTRGPMTAIVIVFEMTQEFSIVLPLMISSVTAYLVAEAISSGSVYKYLLAWNGIYLKPSKQLESRLTKLTAADIMTRQPETISSDLSISEAKLFFARSEHHGLPVLENGKFIGIMTESDFAKVDAFEAALIIKNNSAKSNSDKNNLDPNLDLGETENNGNLKRNPKKGVTIQDIMTQKPITVRSHDPLTQVIYWMNRYHIGHLPVLDRSQLVGIITRADIIRVESEQLSGNIQTHDPRLAKNEASYIVYQTRDPAIGLGRILVPLSDTKTAPELLELAATIAHQRHYELECLMVIPVSRLRSPAETTVSTQDERRLLRKTKALRERHGISIHTQIRVSHDVSSAILEVVRDRHIDLLISNWKGGTTTPDRIFGEVVDTLIRQVRCDVMLIKWGVNHTQRERWLIPTAGGPNSAKAIEWLPGLMKQAEAPEAFLCHVSAPNVQPEVSIQALDKACNQVQLRVSCITHSIAVCNRSISGAVFDLAAQNDCDVILLGATQEGLLEQVIKGNIPEEIARRSPQTVILVRGSL